MMTFALKDQVVFAIVDDDYDEEAEDVATEI